MKILLHGINFAPELTGIGKYTGEMAAWLAEAGHEVRVVTAAPHYPDWMVKDGYCAEHYCREEWEGVKVIRAPVWVPARPGGLKRLLHLASFAVTSLPVMFSQLRWKPDVVWVVEPPLLCAPTALLVARLARARAWLHIQDYEVDAAFALGLLKNKGMRRLALAMETLLMRRFDKVSTICSSMMNRAVEKGVAPERLLYLPNWIDLNKISPLDRTSSYRAELGIPEGSVVALYSGNMGGKQGLEILADAARLLADEGIYFVFCGNGSGKQELVEFTAGLPRVVHLDLQPSERLNELLNLADIHLVPQKEQMAGLVMPSKVTALMASGRTVVATAHRDTELGRLVDHFGKVVRPGDAHAFAEAIRELARDAGTRLQLGAVARNLAEGMFNVVEILNRFEAAMSVATARQAVAPAAAERNAGLPVR